MSEMDTINKIRELRDAFGSFMTGVTIVTTCKDDGTPLGFTANSFASVSLDPALLLVSIAKTSSNYDYFAQATHFAINILAEEQKDISNTFARPSDDRFANLDWRKSNCQNPIIDQVSAWFDCTTYQVVDAGDHAVLIGKVEGFTSTGFAGLGYYRGAYFTPAKSSTDVISGMKVMMMALIGHENQILLEQTSEQKWTLPHLLVDKDGAEKALEKIFAVYQPEASPSFIYSVYDDITTQQQYIAFLCNTPIPEAHKGQFVDLNDLEQLTFVDSALESMLMRYRKENYLKTYGVYYGNQTTGTVRQIVKEEVNYAFSLFVHMERVSDQETHKQLYDEMIELCQIADRGGMHAIWMGEHHAMNFTIAPNPFINLVDLANKTQNVRLGTGTVVAPFWHPIKLAGEAAMADIICNGRLDIGIARGAYSFEYERMVPGMDAWSAGQRLREMIPAIKNLWKGDYEHKGEFWQFPKTTASPTTFTTATSIDLGCCS